MWVSVVYRFDPEHPHEFDCDIEVRGWQTETAARRHIAPFEGISYLVAYAQWVEPEDE